MPSKQMIPGLLVICLVLTQNLSATPACAANEPGEWQVTFSPISHNLDNNDNFSIDNLFLSIDTRDTVGSGIGGGTTIMKVNIWTGEETVIYAPETYMSGDNKAPGLGAASYSPLADEVIFIHGPLLSEVAERGYYGTRNRQGGIVAADGSQKLSWADCRDVTSDTTPKGALRGGTHRHEFTADGSRLGFTYDDFLMQNYPRTLGFMKPASNICGNARYYSTLLIPVVPAGTAKPGEIEQADNDSWVGAKGLMRGFIGKVKQDDGTYMSSLFVVDIPADVDITTNDPGTKTRFPGPPTGVTIRRLTNKPASGIVRGSFDGTRVAYYAAAPDGTNQVFIINSQGSDLSPDPAMRPVQATFFPGGVQGGVRWHPTGNSIAVQADNGVAVICVKPGPLFGISHFVTSHGAGRTASEALVWSRDGHRLAFIRRTPTYDETATLLKDFGGNNFKQIWITDFPDCNQNGIADSIEDGTVRNAANMTAERVAPESMATFLASGVAASSTAVTSIPLPTTLAGVSVEIIDQRGVKRPSLVSAVMPDRVSFVVPAGPRPGAGSVLVTLADGTRIRPDVQIDSVVPGVFSANGTGTGVASATAVRTSDQGKQTDLPVFACGQDGSCTAVPLDLGSATDTVVLSLFATGVRGFASLPVVKIGGQVAEVLRAEPQWELMGLDIVDVVVPRSLVGKGNVNVELTVDGVLANRTTVRVK